MSHKAGSDFFKEKRDWSIRKDRILGSYLKPYLPKIATQRRPVLVVDGFAGPGKFSDGSCGSPVLICELVRERRIQNAHQFRVLAVERDPQLHAQLVTALAPFRDFVTIENKSFAEVLPHIEDAVSRENVFLYLDPFTVTGLSWSALDRVFRQLSRQHSIEFLLNFNVFALARAACVALGKKFKDETSEDNLGGESASTRDTVNDVLGGDWWQEPFMSSRSFPEACTRLCEGYVRLVKSRFPEVCWHEIKEKHAHAVPKYVLVFGSRHPDALELMNDAMCQSLQHLAASEAPVEPTLFETRDVKLVPPTESMRKSILDLASHRRQRGELIHAVIRLHFGKYMRSAIRGEIENLLKDGKMQSETGKVRINDDVNVWRSR